MHKITTIPKIMEISTRNTTWYSATLLLMNTQSCIVISHKKPRAINNRVSLQKLYPKRSIYLYHIQNIGLAKAFVNSLENPTFHNFVSFLSVITFVGHFFHPMIGHDHRNVCSWLEFNLIWCLVELFPPQHVWTCQQSSSKREAPSYLPFAGHSIVNVIFLPVQLNSINIKIFCSVL